MQQVSKIKIGITGGIGSGKSFLLNEFKKRDYCIINLDDFVHELYKKPNKLFYVVDEAFSLSSTDEIDRSKLKEIVFKDMEKLTLLNNITHSVIKEELIKKINSIYEEVIVVEIPLLFEAKFDDLVDFIVLAYSDLNTRIDRITKRDIIDENTAKNIIDRQINLEEKVELSDYIVYTNKNNDFDKIIEDIVIKAGEKSES